MGKVQPYLGAVATAGNRNVQIGDLKAKKLGLLIDFDKPHLFHIQNQKETKVPL